MMSTIQIKPDLKLLGPGETCPFTAVIPPLSTIIENGLIYTFDEAWSAGPYELYR